MTNIVFVCLGNICRSPTAEGILIDLINKRDLSNRISVDSAGTSGWHQGSPPDTRSQQTAQARGIQLPSHSRQFRDSDFLRFDYIIAMDQDNLRNILQLAKNKEDEDRVYLLRDFDSASPENSDIPDPYYGGEKGFDHVFDLCMRGCNGLLNHITAST